jgi:hypothetical protein
MFYYYWIQASNEVKASNPLKGGRSPMSNMAFDETKLAPPEWFWVEILEDGNVQIRWTEVAGAKGYQLFFESGKTNATFDFPIAFDTKVPTKFSIKPGTPDTLSYIDKDFDFIQKGATLFYTACGIKNFAANGDYKRDEIGDKWMPNAKYWTPNGRMPCKGRNSDTKK